MAERSMEISNLKRQLMQHEKSLKDQQSQLDSKGNLD